MSGQVDLDLLAAAPELPVVARRIAIIDADAMPQEIMRAPEHAVAGNVVGRSQEQSPYREQSPRDQDVNGWIEDLQGDVIAFLDDVHHSVVDDDVEHHIGVLLLVFPQDHREMPEGEPRQNMQPKRALWRTLKVAHLRGDALQARDKFGTFLEVSGADFRQLDHAGGTVKKGRLDELLELLDALGHNGLGDAELASCFGEALLLGHPYKGLNAQKPVQAIPPPLAYRRRPLPKADQEFCSKRWCGDAPVPRARH